MYAIMCYPDIHTTPQVILNTEEGTLNLVPWRSVEEAFEVTKQLQACGYEAFTVLALPVSAVVL